MESETSSSESEIESESSSDTLDELLEAQDNIIMDLREEIDKLRKRIETLKAIAKSTLVPHLNLIIDNL